MSDGMTPIMKCYLSDSAPHYLKKNLYPKNLQKLNNWKIYIKDWQLSEKHFSMQSMDRMNHSE